MKRIILAVACSLLVATTASAEWDVLFDKNPEPECVGYKIYNSDVSGGPYTEVAECTDLEVKPDGYLHCLVDTPYTTQYFVLTAYAEGYTGMSEYSAEIKSQGQLGAPVGRHTVFVDVNVTVEVN